MNQKYQSKRDHQNEKKSYQTHNFSNAIESGEQYKKIILASDIPKRFQTFYHLFKL